MKRSFRRNLKAVSPVIATIIIVAIAIVMSIAVAYWMLGLGAAFTRYEKLEFTTAYATKNDTDFTIHLRVKNTGSAIATIDIPSILYNGKPDTGYATPPATPVTWFNATTLDPGASATGTVALPVTTTWVSGMTVELMVHTTAGRDYPKVIILP